MLHGRFPIRALRWQQWVVSSLSANGEPKFTLSPSERPPRVVADIRRPAAIELPTGRARFADDLGNGFEHGLRFRSLDVVIGARHMRVHPTRRKRGQLRMAPIRDQLGCSQ